MFNTNLRDALEIGNMIELAQTVVAGAIQRKESRGSHFMVEFPKRDDANFLSHTSPTERRAAADLARTRVDNEMAAHGKEILMPPAKKLRDLRGPQSRISRLARFHFEGFIHVLAYRIMVPLTILYGLLIVAYLLAPGLGALLKVVTAVVWALWTPQLFEVAKGLALAWSRGMVFGRLNDEFAHLYRKRYRARTGLRALPWLALAVWVAGFIVMIAEVAAMKASFFMFFDYLTMMGVPVLLVLLALSALLAPRGAIQTVLLILIAAGAVVYGIIGIREAFVHGRRHHEAAGR